MMLLTPEEREVVGAVVDALCEHNEPLLRALGAYDDGADPFEPTRHWRLWDQVDLVRPAGDPIDWEAWSGRNQDSGWAWVDVRMLTMQEGGPSDLIVHLDVRGNDLLYRGMWT